MIFNAFQREDADNVYTISRNVSGATVSAGAVVAWDITASIDGVRVSKPATATLSACQGIAVESIADSAYGKIQVYGYNAGAYVTNTTNQAIAAGNILIPVDAQHYLVYSGPGDGKSGFFYAGEAFATATTPAQALKKLLIRGM